MTVLYDSKDAFNFIKEQYEELYATERHLGTLRARMAWVPATIAVAIVAIFVRQQGAPPAAAVSTGVIGVGLVMMCVVLTLIFLSDLYLLRQQKIASQMCKECERLWLEAAGKHEGGVDRGSEIKKFSELRSEATRLVGGERVLFGDPANILLFIYFVTLAVMALLLSGVGSHLYSWAGDSGSALARLLCPSGQ